MTEYIERADLYEAMNSQDCEFSLIDALALIEEFPAADVAPARHGRWIFDHMTGGWSYYSHCSECNYQEFFANEDVEKRHKYCLNCGARMGKEDEHD